MIDDDHHHHQNDQSNANGFTCTRPAGQRHLFMSPTVLSLSSQDDDDDDDDSGGGGVGADDDDCRILSRQTFTHFYETC